jgi:phage gp46-like protein
VLEGIASAVEVETEIPERGRLALIVTVTRSGETPSRFQYVWESL